MKKPAQSESKREIVLQEQHEPQNQLEQQTSQAFLTPEMSEPAQASDTSAPSSEVQDAEAANEERGAEDVGSAQDVQSPKVTRARRRKRKIEAMSEEEITPRPSYWPLALACALVILLFGMISHPIVMAVGAILVISCVIGWSLERR